MIHVVTRPRPPRLWITEFARAYAPELVAEVRYFDHDRLLSLAQWPEARAWIFSVDVRAEQVRHKLLAIEARLRATNQRVLNAPSSSLPRFDLLRRLHADGINAFQAHASRPSEASSWRYPIFVRSRTDHDGSWTQLLHSEEDYRRAIAASPRLVSREAMVVEFCDTRDEHQLYCKRSVMRVGDRFVPRHALYNPSWVTKTSGAIDADRAAEELRFVEAGIVPPEVVAAFDAAGVQYGRVDYGLLRGRPQIWEININPAVVPPLSSIAPLRHEAQRRSAAGVRSALAALARE